MRQDVSKMCSQVISVTHEQLRTSHTCCLRGCDFGLAWNAGVHALALIWHACGPKRSLLVLLRLCGRLERCSVLWHCASQGRLACLAALQEAVLPLYLGFT